MKHLYFFVSSNTKDELSTMTVLAKSIKSAYALAIKSFKQNNYEGEPQLLAI